MNQSASPDGFPLVASNHEPTAAAVPRLDPMTGELSNFLPWLHAFLAAAIWFGFSWFSSRWGAAFVLKPFDQLPEETHWAEKAREFFPGSKYHLRLGLLLFVLRGTRMSSQSLCPSRLNLTMRPPGNFACDDRSLMCTVHFASARAWAEMSGASFGQ